MEVPHSFNLLDFNRSMKEGEAGELWQDRLGVELFEAAILFAETINGDVYFWAKPTQPTSGVAELPIYYSPRHKHPIKCADSYADWVLNACLTPAEDEEGKSRWYFRRFYPD
jgi:hypothetical protein